MRYHIVIFFLLLYSFGKSQNDSRFDLVDDLVNELNLDSAYYEFLKIDSDSSIDYTFRKQFFSFLSNPSIDEKIIPEIDSFFIDFEPRLKDSSTFIHYYFYYGQRLDNEVKPFEKVIQSYDYLLSYFEENTFTDTLFLVNLLHNRGNETWNYSKYEESLTYIERAISLNDSYSRTDQKLKGIMLYNLAQPYYYLDQYEKCYDLIQKAERILSSLEDTDLDYLTSCYQELVTYYVETGFYEKAKGFVDKSFNIFRKNQEIFENLDQDPVLYHYYLYMYVYAYSDEDEIEESKKIIRKVESYIKGKEISDKNKVSLGAIYNYMGEIFVINNPLESLQYYKKAIASNKNSPSYVLQYEFNLCKAYFNAKFYNEALILADKIIPIGEKSADYRLPFFYALKVNIYRDLKNLDSTTYYLNQMVNAINESEEKIDLNTNEKIENFLPNTLLYHAYLMSDFATLQEEAFGYDELNQRIASNLYYISLVQFNANYKEAGLSEKARSQFDDIILGNLKAFENDISQFGFTELLENIDNVRSRFLWENFVVNHSDLIEIDKDLQSKEKELRKDLVKVKSLILDAGMQNLDSINQILFDTEFELEKLNQLKKEQYHSYVTFSEESANIPSIQKRLNDHQVIISFYEIKKELYSFLISNQAIKVNHIGNVDQLSSTFQFVTAELRNYNNDEEILRDSLEKLGELLIPTEAIGYTNWVIIPDGMLHKIPFEVLVRDDSYLIMRHTISYATSLAFVFMEKENNPVKKTMVFAPSYEDLTTNSEIIALRGSAYNLEGALSEANTISKIIPSEIYSHERATKPSFVNNAPQADILHLSMHSFMNDEDPELSSLIFHDRTEDYKLFITELYGQKLNAQMAVLSACNTGIGTEKSGAGLVSMNRAFIYSGVPTVVSSLWSAPDKATEKIMENFYKEVKNGSDKDEALRMAKLNYIKEEETEAFKHPFFWAGFVIHGNTDQFTFASFKYAYLFSGLLILLAGLIFIKRWKT